MLETACWEKYVGNFILWTVCWNCQDSKKFVNHFEAITVLFFNANSSLKILNWYFLFEFFRSFHDEEFTKQLSNLIYKFKKYIKNIVWKQFYQLTTTKASDVLSNPFLNSNSCLKILNEYLLFEFFLSFHDEELTKQLSNLIYKLKNRWKYRFENSFINTSMWKLKKYYLSPS